MELGELRVVGTEQITPMMMRVRLGGESLTRFRSVSPDQQAEFFFPKPGAGVSVPALSGEGTGQEQVAGWYQAFLAMPERERPWMRSFSIRRFDPGPADRCRLRAARQRSGIGRHRGRRGTGGFLGARGPPGRRGRHARPGGVAPRFRFPSTTGGC